MTGVRTIREILGVLALDWPRYLRSCRNDAGNKSAIDHWTRLGNRKQTLEFESDGRGVRCQGRWSIPLHACDVFPSLGRKLLKRVLQDYNFKFSETPQKTDAPTLSFIFAHSGTNRLPLLRQVISSVYGMTDVSAECIVVNVSADCCRSALPEHVVYIHVDNARVRSGWYKSWAYNIGARHAGSDVLVFHDGDILAPQNYGRLLLERLKSQKYDAASLQRFLFYLSEEATSELIWSHQFVPSKPTCVLQNWVGGTIGVRKDSFFSIGGFDEGFVDWGGEDDEFFDRCRTLKHSSFGFVPFVHLWHPPQTARRALDNLNESVVLPARLRISPHDRIAELQSRSFGNLQNPDPIVAYKDMTKFQLQAVK